MPPAPPSRGLCPSEPLGFSAFRVVEGNSFALDILDGVCHEWWGQKRVSEVVTTPMSLGWAPRGSSPALLEPSADGQSLPWCRRRGSTVGTLRGACPDTLGLLQLCPLGPQHEGFGGDPAPGQDEGRWDAKTHPLLGIGEIQAELGAK